MTILTRVIPLSTRIRRAICAFGMLLMLTAPPMISSVAHAAISRAITSARAIESAAELAVRARAGSDAGKLSLTLAPLDPRLRLPACDQPLQAFLTEEGRINRQTTVGVRCAGSVRWTIYTSMTVESTTQVLVARYALPRDATLTAADFDLQTRRVAGLGSAYPADAAALLGQHLRMPVRAGDPLTQDALAPAPLVKRGQQVIILAHAAGFEVRMAGVALADGRISDQIRVQNISSQRIIEAVVRSDSVVEAPL